MPKRDEAAEYWQTRKSERIERARAKKQTKIPPPEFDLQQTLSDLHAPEETARARAARELCPCRTDWDVFEQNLETLRRMTKDPSPVVRANALHVFEDASEIDNEGLPTSPQMITNEMAARRLQMRWRREDEEDESRRQTENRRNQRKAARRR